MASDVDICNLALAAIGTRSSISALDEGSTESNACALQYTVARDAVLGGVHWNFARKQALMAVLKDASLGQSVPPPWNYEYAYPSDCLQGRYVMPQLAATGGGVPGTVPVQSIASAPVYFLVGSDTDSNGNDQNVILTNQPQAILVYTKRITNPSLFGPDFVDAFAYYLASRICIALTGDKGLARGMFDMADKLVKAAQTSNGNEGITVIDSVPDWIRVRGYSSDWAYPPGSITWCQPTQLSMVT